MMLLSPMVMADHVTLTTYYPSPFGVYSKLRLHPMDSLPPDPYCNDDDDLGLMYYDNGLNEKVEGVYACLRIAENSFKWVLMSRDIPDHNDPHCEDSKDLGRVYFNDGTERLPEGIYVCKKHGKVVFSGS